MEETKSTTIELINECKNILNEAIKADGNWNYKYKTTLLDFLRLYDFGFHAYDEDCRFADDKHNTQIIRVHLPDTDLWFEIGACTKYGASRTVDIIEMALKEDIISANIETIRYNPDIETVEVFLTTDERWID